MSLFETLANIAFTAGLEVLDQHRGGIFESMSRADQVDQFARNTIHVENKNELTKELAAPVIAQIIEVAAEKGTVVKSD